MNKNARKVALVTGGAKGIGHQISLCMAEAGYDVAVNYRSGPGEAEEIRRQILEMGRDAIAVYADMSNLDDIDRMYNEVYAHFGTLDVLINNAGVGVEAYFLDTTEEMFDYMTGVDWKGLFFSSQQAARRMMEQKKKGVIINISSNQAVGNWPRSTVYAPTKAAVEKFTKNAAMELVDKGIRVCAVAPGYTDVGWPPGDHRWEAADRLPMKRFATMREIARGCVYLASDDADYITGTTLSIDGGALLPVVAENDFVKSQKK